MNCPYTIDQIFTIAVNSFLLGAAFVAGLWFVIWWRKDNAKMEREEQEPPEKNVPRGGKGSDGTQ